MEVNKWIVRITYIFEKVIPFILSLFILHGSPKPLGFYDVHSQPALWRRSSIVLVHHLHMNEAYNLNLKSMILESTTTEKY